MPKNISYFFALIGKLLTSVNPIHQYYTDKDYFGGGTTETRFGRGDW